MSPRRKKLRAQLRGRAAVVIMEKGESPLAVICTIVVLTSGSIRVDFKGPVKGKPGRLELLRAAMEIVRQGDE